VLVGCEQPARQRLRQLLAAVKEADVEVVGEAEDGEQAIERIVELKPDVVLLDIQMPGCSGMEVAASLPSPRPKIIFCTAFDEHAVHYWMQPTLSELEGRLDPARFFRISRAAIVNLDAVREVIPREGGPGEAKLSNGTAIGVSRRRMTDLMARLGQG